MVTCYDGGMYAIYFRSHRAHALLKFETLAEAYAAAMGMDVAAGDFDGGEAHDGKELLIDEQAYLASVDESERDDLRAAIQKMRVTAAALIKKVET